ncbi:MAG: hypothetical protein KY455_09970 [Euryarchaeota archaeon]|nr:hypothetical protein [Euryarchaeota archaeon]
MESDEHGRIIVRPVAEGWDVVDEHETILLHGLPDENRAISEAEEIARRDDAEVEVIGLDGSTKEIRHLAGEGRTKGLD